MIPRFFQRLYSLSVCFIAGFIIFLGINALPILYADSKVIAESITSTHLVQQGIELYQSGKYPEAIALLQQALSQSSEPQNRAVILNNLAQSYRQIGKLDRAIAHWDQAIEIYQSSKDNINRRLVAQLIIEQAQAYNDLGQHERAISLLQEAQKIANKSQDPLTESAAQGVLGNAYWAIGDYDRAINAHQDSLKIAREQKNTGYITTALNNIGNVYVSRAERYLNQANAANLEGDDAEESRLTQLAQKDTNGALDAFQQSVQESSAGGMTQIRALLNLNRMLENSQLQANNITIPAKEDLIASNRAQALRLLETEPDSQDKAYALINLAVSNNLSSARGKIAKDGNLNSTQLLEKALTVARNIGDRRAESFALGTLGQVYESDNQYTKAMELTRQAQFASQQINAADSLYRWQWQSGRIFKLTGQRQQAIASYEQAIATLQSIRGDIVAANKELQFNFRDSVEPVYRQLIALLLDSPSSVVNSKELTIEKTQNLSKVLNVLDLLKLAELQNFFGDECVQVALNNATKEQVAQANVTREQIAQSKALLGKIAQGKGNLSDSLKLADPKTAVIYSVILDDHSEMILQLADGTLKNYRVPMDTKLMQTEIDRLRALLEKRSTDEYLFQAKKIYDALIRPMEADIAAAKPSTLIFIQDGVLRKVPMAALHDGKEFLIQKYALARTPSLSLTSPKAYHGNFQGLIVGLTVERPPFEALPNVRAEVTGVQKILGGTELLDKSFTVKNFQEKLEKNSYPIVHMATHGKFGVDSESTFLLGYDSLITIDELDKILRSRSAIASGSSSRRQPVELLTLSACQTAAGDNRSALGIAGVAVRAGVKSALATLWFINDESTVPLVEEFYTQLRQPNVTKAEALRRAQLKLIANEDYNHPAVWSPFLLIGNWL